MVIMDPVGRRVLYLRISKSHKSKVFITIPWSQTVFLNESKDKIVVKLFYYKTERFTLTHTGFITGSINDVQCPGV